LAVFSKGNMKLYQEKRKGWGQNLTISLALALSIEYYLRFSLVSVRNRPFDGKTVLMEVALK